MPPELGNYNLAAWANSTILPMQSLPEITVDSFYTASGLNYARPNTTKVLQNQPPLNTTTAINGTIANMTDLVEIQKRFDLAETYKDMYDYAIFMVLEEFYHPQVTTRWHPTVVTLATYYIDGTITIEGVQIDLLKQWYTAKYGSWNQS